MGAQAYWYIVPYESDISAALEKLRLREFRAGRYNPVVEYPEFPVTDQSPAPGPQHASIEEVFAALYEAGSADGTRSILDIFQVSSEPLDENQDSFCTAFPLSQNALVEFFGNKKPNWEQVRKSATFWDSIPRGSAVYITLYPNGEPSELLFVGVSFD